MKTSKTSTQAQTKKDSKVDKLMNFAAFLFVILATCLMLLVFIPSDAKTAIMIVSIVVTITFLGICGIIAFEDRRGA